MWCPLVTTNNATTHNHQEYPLHSKFQFIKHQLPHSGEKKSQLLLQSHTSFSSAKFWLHPLDIPNKRVSIKLLLKFGGFFFHSCVVLSFKYTIFCSISSLNRELPDFFLCFLKANTTVTNQYMLTVTTYDTKKSHLGQHLIYGYGQVSPGW